MRILSFLFLVAFLSGCSDNQAVNSPEEIEFGAQYSLVQTSDVPYINNNGTLVATVAYSGCNGNHEFELKHSKIQSTSELWLFKQTADQACHAFFEEEKSFTLFDSIIDSEEIVLIAPSEDRIPLK